MEMRLRERGRHPRRRVQFEQRPGDSAQPGAQGRQEQLVVRPCVRPTVGGRADGHWAPPKVLPWDLPLWVHLAALSQPPLSVWRGATVGCPGGAWHGSQQLPDMNYLGQEAF